MQDPSPSGQVISAERLCGAVSALAATTQAVLSSFHAQSTEDVAAMLGLQRVLEVSSCILEIAESSCSWAR